MPTVRLFEREYLEGGLPAVCVYCGDKAEHFKTYKLSWIPGWTAVFILLGVLPYFIAAMALTMRRSLDLPVCEKDRSLQFNARLLSLGIFLGGMALSVASIVLGIALSTRQNSVFPPFLGIAALLFIGMFIGLIVVNRKQLRATDITDRSIKITRLNAAFIDAVLNSRDDEDRSVRFSRSDRDRDRDRDRRRDRDDRVRGRDEGRDRNYDRADRRDDDRDRQDRDR